MTTAFLIDLPSIVFPLWHVTASDPNPNATSIQALDRIRSLTHGQPTAAICTDSKRSVRRDADPTYKAQRKGEDRATLYHQMDLVIDALRADGYPIWTVDGYEADDVIASATARALQVPGATVQIVSADKDLLALVNDRVTLKSLKDGGVIDAATVQAKFGVKPEQIHDYLCLVGDAADNIKGADKIGPVTAVKLLGAYGTLDGVYKAWGEKPDQFTPAIQASLGTFLARVDDVRNLVRLRADLAIPFEEIAVERTAPLFDMPEVEGEEESPFAFDADPTGPTPPAPGGPGGDMPPPAVHEPTLATATQTTQSMPASEPTTTAAPAPARRTRQPKAAPAAVVDAVKPPEPAAPVVEPAPAPEPPPAEQQAIQSNEALRPMPKSLVPQVVDAEYTRQLEPRTMADAIQLAKFAFESRLFGAFGSPQACLLVIMAGRELGMPTMHALRAFDIIEGKPTLKADALRATVIRSGILHYFRCTERTAERATFKAKRGDDPEITLTYTIAEANAAGLVKPNSGWAKNPADMLVARAGSKLARLIAPDVIHGIYSTEEFD